MKKNRITLKDIAEKASTSIRTVTRVINNTGSVKEQTRERIKRVIADLNYEPNLIARSLKSNKSKSIGIVYIDFGSETLENIINGIESVAETYDYSIIVTDSKINPDIENRNINNLINRMVDGIIIFPSSSDFSYIERINRLGIPTVTIGYVPKNIESYYVNNDNKAGIIAAVEFLIANGHKKIVYINLGFDLYAAKIGLKYFKATLEKHCLHFDKNLVFCTDSTIQGSYEVSREIFSKNLDFTAILCWNDQTAIGVLKYCMENNIRIPDDYSLMGFDNDEKDPYLIVPLTTVHLQKFEIGREAAKLLFDIIMGKKIINRNVTFEPKIIKRESVKDISETQ